MTAYRENKPEFTPHKPGVGMVVHVSYEDLRFLIQKFDGQRWEVVAKAVADWVAKERDGE